VNPYSTSNGWKLPFVVSPTCRMISTTGGSGCGEEWLKAGTVLSPKGGIGFTGTTYSGGGYPFPEARSAMMEGTFDGLFNHDSCGTIGYAVSLGRQAVLDSLPTHPERWDHYNGYLCIGDPELWVWTGIPRELTVDLPEVIPIGPFEVPVTVSTDGIPIRYALVCITNGGSVYSYGYTDGNGEVSLPIETLVPDTLDLTVTGRNCVPVETTVVTVSEGPHLYYRSHLVDDDDEGASSGDGNGEVNPGETVEISIDVWNAGIEPAFEVEGRVSLSDGWVTLLDSVVSFGTVGSGDTVLSLDPIVFQVAFACTSGHPIEFDLTYVDSSGQEWEDGFAETVRMIDLEFSSYSADDGEGGNGDGMIAPGETVELDLTLGNAGLADAREVVGVLSSLDPYVDVLQDSSDFSFIPSLGVGSSVTPYLIYVHPDCPEPHSAPMEFDLTGDYGYVDRDTFVLEIKVGSFSHHLDDTLGWSHGPVSGGYGDEWHWSTERSLSPTHSFKCGTDGGIYDNSLDAGLVTPEFELDPNSELSFWYWIDAETLPNHNHQCRDAGLVKISVDGGGFAVINPEGGYPYLIMGGTGHPFSGFRGFSGRSDGWTQARFDLSPFSGTARLQFRFGTDQSGGREGWYVDDLLVRGLREADIDLNPWEIAQTLLPDSSAQVPLFVYNTGGEALDFEIEVTSGESWLWVAPSSGQVGSDDSSEVVLELDAAGLSAGSYEGRLEVQSNDPDEPWVVVPVHLEVVEGICGDANGDGSVTPGDGYLILNYPGAGPEPQSCFAANVNGDSGITPGDGFYLLNYLGTGPELGCSPCELSASMGSSRRGERSPRAREIH
jgi:hypothetical protein